MENISDRIAASFGQATSTYHAHAHLQQYCAQTLFDLLEHSLEQLALPAGPVLEIGCGTGFITELLCDRLSHHSPDDKRFKSLPAPSSMWHGRDYHITDLSTEMVSFCRDRLQSKITVFTSNKKISGTPRALTRFLFQPLNAESLPVELSCYSLIIGGFVAQWFQDIESTIQQLLNHLKPDGRLLLSFPGDESFPEWRQQCNHLNIPFTAHPLPNSTTILKSLALSPQQYQVQLKSEWYSTYYDNAADFFRSMKAIGAGLSQSSVQLKPSQMRSLLHQWQSSVNRVSPNACSLKQIEVQYQIIYLLILKTQNFENIELVKRVD